MYPSFNARAVGLTLTAFETIEIAAEAGFVGVDLLVRDMHQAGVRFDDVRRQMENLGLVGGAFPLPVNWRGDEPTLSRDLDELDRLADLAASLGLTRTGTWVMPEVPLTLAGTDDFRRTLAFHLDRLGTIAAVLGSRGIQLGLEVIGVERSRSGATPRFMTRISDLRPLLDPLQLAHPNVGVLLDTFHLYAADEALADALEVGGESIVWVHIADLPSGASADRTQIEDAFRGLPGDHGAVESQSTLQTLRERGYQGPVTAEPLGRCSSIAGLNARKTALAVARSLRSIWPR